MRKFLTAAVALSVLASAGAASAQPGPQNSDRRYEQRDDRRDNRQDARDDRRDDRQDYREDRRDDRYEQRAARRYQAGRYKAPRGYQARQWHRGDTLPGIYRSRSYIVDHRRYGLSAPPRGYQYVRVNNDVVMTAIATGVVASVILQLFQ